jgi:mycoredoxin-dependent peroxiredoxin
MLSRVPGRDFAPGRDRGEDVAIMSGLICGGPAPDFTLRDQFGQDVTLSAFRGRKAVALMFFPFAFSGVCTGEMSGVRDRLAEFMTFETEVLAISCDPVYALRSFADGDGLNFPLLSDFWPHGEVAQAYEVFDSERGMPRRSSYVIDREGLIRWSVHNAMPRGRDLDEHLRQLEAALEPREPR